MKKIFSLGMVLMIFANMSLVSAEFVTEVPTLTSVKVNVYTTSEAFLKAEGNTCEVATDGCNTIMIDNGTFGASTLKYCADTPVEYSCIKEKEEARICTMQYAPVCGIDNVTYGNSCMAGDVEIAYENECQDKVDSELYVKLGNNIKNVNYLDTILEKQTTLRLQNISKKADTMIGVTKLLKIAQWLQIERITKYTFIKDLIAKEIESRK